MPRKHSALNRAMAAEVAALRAREGLTQKQAAELTASGGVGIATWQRIEAGAVAVSIDHLVTICEALDGDMVDMMSSANRLARRRTPAPPQQ